MTTKQSKTQQGKTKASKKAVSKKSYHHGDLRNQLLDAAALMIREEGEAALSMRKLADRVGVSRTAAYHHFTDKQALLCSIAEEGFRRFIEMGQLLDSIDDMNQFLTQHVRSYVNFAIDNAEYYDLMFSGQIWKSKSLTETLKDKAYESFRLNTERITALCEKHQLPQELSSLRFGQVTWSTLHGLSRLLIDGIYVEQEAIDSICESTVQVLMQSFKS